MITEALVISAIFLLAVNGIAHSGKNEEQGGRPGGTGTATLLSLGGVFFCGLMAPVVGVSALLLAPAGAVCWWFRARPRWFTASSLAATAAAFLIFGLPHVLEWHRLKKEFPVESVANRLRYEDRPRKDTAGRRDGFPSRDVDVPAREVRLVALEKHVQEAEFSARTQSLKVLHAGVVRQFVNSPAFGVGRMIRMTSPAGLEQELRERQVAPEGEPPLPQPGPVYVSPDPAPAESRPAAEPEFLTAHEKNVLDFLNPNGFGYVKDREHVVGFRPHRFGNPPEAPGRWRVGRVELVGILKYDEPVVYVSANLPRMEELRKAQTRPLDGFERKALDGLLAGEDLMVQESPPQMRLFGSIRAAEQCVRCHRARRGELLGAFSYGLRAE